MKSVRLLIWAGMAICFSVGVNASQREGLKKDVLHWNAVSLLTVDENEIITGDGEQRASAFSRNDICSGSAVFSFSERKLIDRICRDDHTPHLNGTAVFIFPKHAVDVDGSAKSRGLPWKREFSPELSRAVTNNRLSARAPDNFLYSNVSGINISSHGHNIEGEPNISSWGCSDVFERRGEPQVPFVSACQGVTKQFERVKLYPWPRLRVSMGRLDCCDLAPVEYQSDGRTSVNYSSGERHYANPELPPLHLTGRVYVFVGLAALTAAAAYARVAGGCTMPERAFWIFILLVISGAILVGVGGGNILADSVHYLAGSS